MVIGGMSRRGRACATVLAMIFLSIGVSPALAQGGVLPADVAQAIDASIAAGNAAADNAAISAAIARAPSYDDVAARTRMRVSETAITEAVVSGIARYPGSTSAIVSAAIERAPGYRDAIVHRANLAFPAFTNEIASGAGMAPPAADAPAPSYTQTPSYSQIPRYSQIQGDATYDRPTVMAGPDQATTAPGETAIRSEATAPGRAGPWFGISELRLGVLHHDAGVFGNSKEDGVDVTIEVRFARFTGGFWDTIGQPRAHLGANINSEGNTSSAYTGLTWDWQIWGPVFFSFDLGGALHDGETSSSRGDEKELGSRALFRAAVEIGYRFHERHALSLRLDHLSNAFLADNNEGLDTLGVVYGYSF